MTEQEYGVFCRPFDRALQKLVLDFRFFQEDMAGLNVLSVNSRLKSLSSATRKQAELNLPIEEMHDIAGMRIVVSTEPEIEVVRSYFATQEGFKALKVVDDKVVNRNGYRARHLVLEFDWTVQMPKHARVEVQIVTALQHAFNSVSRAWVYKSSLKPRRSWERRLSKISHALAEVDQTISELQSELVLATSSTAANEPLSAFSFQSIVNEMLGEGVSIHDSVDAVRWLTHLGLTTNQDLRTFFANEAAHTVPAKWIELAGNGNQVAQVFSEMPKHQFLVWWETRGDGTSALQAMILGSATRSEDAG